jgi:hypothetical protein
MNWGWLTSSMSQGSSVSTLAERGRPFEQRELTEEAAGPEVGQHHFPTRGVAAQQSRPPAQQHVHAVRLIAFLEDEPIGFDRAPPPRLRELLQLDRVEMREERDLLEHRNLRRRRGRHAPFSSLAGLRPPTRRTDARTRTYRRSRACQGSTSACAGAVRYAHRQLRSLAARWIAWATSCSAPT